MDASGCLLLLRCNDGYCTSACIFHAAVLPDSFHIRILSQLSLESFLFLACFDLFEKFIVNLIEIFLTFVINFFIIKNVSKTTGQ